MHLLSLLRGSSQASADSPYWLVSNDDLAPIRAHDLENFTELGLIDCLSQSDCTLSGILTNTSHHLKTMIDGNFDFLSNS